MKRILYTWLVLMVFASCRKDKEPSIVGKWVHTETEIAYIHPYTGTAEIKTDDFYSRSIEFKRNGDFYGDDVPVGTYEFLNDSTYRISVAPGRQFVVISLTNERLITKRKGEHADHLKFFDPSGNGMFQYAIPSSITTYFFRE